MNRPRTLLLDSEAVQALASPAHPKHRRVIAMVHEFASRRIRGVGSSGLVVPTAVRVEAGWDRRSPTAATLNRLRITDFALDRDSADQAARIRSLLNTSVADAHLAVSLSMTPGPHVIVTSDTDDMRKIAEYLDTPVTIVRL